MAPVNVYIQQLASFPFIGPVLALVVGVPICVAGIFVTWIELS